MQVRAAKAGAGPVLVSPDAVTRMLRDLTSATDTVTAAQLGELLFGVVALARERDLDAEESLRMAVRRFRDAVAAREESRPPA